MSPKTKKIFFSKIKLMYMKISCMRWIFLGISFLFFTMASGQVDDCECEDGTIVICYLPENDYCNSNEPFATCGYNLDGDLMENYLRRKLLNNDNFGINGTVQCPLELNALEEGITVDYLNDQECDVVFVGNFGVDTLTFSPNIEMTSLSDDLLSSIREWSLLCPANLVIATQEEADMWGYIIENENENPNSPSGIDVGLNIFDGPFGEVSSFNQGGSYQGVITSGPSTGFTVLAVDNLGRPTAVIDSLTNDLIFGDIGIFCGGGAGSISFGDEVNNKNDRFTCNIFALGCSIAGNQNPPNDIAICPGETYRLPSGQQVSMEGTYLDTLIAANFCDSIVITNLSIKDSITNFMNYFGCLGDGFEITVGNVTYNENNPIGDETLVSSEGCDSTVFVDLVFAASTSSVFQESICEGDDIEFLIASEIFDQNRLEGTVVLENAKGCDSIVEVMIILETDFMETEEYVKCGDEPITIRDKVYMEPGSDTLFFLNNGGCDSIYIINIESFDPIPTPPIRNSLEIYFDEEYEITIPIGDNYSILWEPSNIVSCSTCNTTTILSDGSSDTLSYTIFDENLCSRTFDINLTYLCHVYLPNAISIQNKGSVNSLFGPMRNRNCDISDEYEMSIFDRWGNLLFYSDDPSMKWDGQFNKKSVNLGVYVYYITYLYNGKRVKKFGDITVL